MFDNIIGYDAVKNELLMFIDLMNNPEHYKRFGAPIPRGILLYGPPGVGKTLCCTELINSVRGRNVYTLRKCVDLPNVMKDTFEEAKSHTPSIIFLDDIDKYNEDDNGYGIFNTLQALIDETKGYDVFIIGTANDIYHMPYSLQRAGRFDRIMEINIPSGNVAQKIMYHYLADKPIDQDVDIEEVSKILSYKSCATLESVVNMASIYAGYDRSPTIKMKHMIESILAIVYDKPVSDFKSSPEDLEYTAYHEAGHAVVSEILTPGSVALITIRRKDSHDGCFALSPVDDTFNIKKTMDDIHVGFGGKVATELKYGHCDGGASSDMNKVCNMITAIMQQCGYYGFQYVSYDEQFQNSNYEILKRCDTDLYRYLEQFYNETKNILMNNWSFVDCLARELMQRETITASTVKAIKQYLGYPT